MRVRVIRICEICQVFEAAAALVRMLDAGSAPLTGWRCPDHATFESVPRFVRWQATRGFSSMTISGLSDGRVVVQLGEFVGGNLEKTQDSAR